MRLKTKLYNYTKYFLFTQNDDCWHQMDTQTVSPVFETP